MFNNQKHPDKGPRLPQDSQRSSPIIVVKESQLDAALAELKFLKTPEGQAHQQEVHAKEKQISEYRQQLQAAQQSISDRFNKMGISTLQFAGAITCSAFILSLQPFPDWAWELWAAGIAGCGVALCASWYLGLKVISLEKVKCKLITKCIELGEECLQVERETQAVQINSASTEKR